MYQHDPPGASARRLFEHVFGDAQGYMVTFTGQQARLTKPDARHNELARIEQRSFAYPADAGEASDHLLAQAAAQRDTYFGVHLFRERGSRLAANAVPTVRALWLDEDEGEYPLVGPEPTAIVRSSATRRHLYWLLSHPVSVEWAVAMNRRIASWSGGDIGKAGLASVLRAPGTRNFKRYPQIDPVVGELTGVAPWEPEILEQAIPPLPEPERGSRFAAGYTGPPIDLVAYLEAADVQVLAEVSDLSGIKFAVLCPWIQEHSGGDRTGTYVGRFADGAPWFHCWHEHCRGKGWTEFRRLARPKGSVSVNLRSPRASKGTVVIRLG